MPVVRVCAALRQCGPCGRIALFLLSGLSFGLIKSGGAFAQPVPAMQQEVDYPFATYIAEAAQRFNIPEGWIVAVMDAESAGDTHAVSHAGAMGLMQVMPGTWDYLRARYRLGSDPFDPRDNIFAGAAYLREMYDRYGTIPAMLAAYNAGPDRYDEYLATGRPLPAETRAYVDQLAPALGVATQSVDAPAAPPLPPDWREAPLFVPRSNDRRTAADRTADKPSARSSAFVPVQHNVENPSDPKAMFVVQNTTRGTP
ncbi:lytic transglycosylase domain-containing protein [Chelativorans salis]|uniref:Lytic transglycosylase domain-containing protein n=1 Tax=Chelativorans salis TaxID=2978478 RepID=A0ABT2LRT6_9HYPH|nr:lytic transglycosylase domain-containing protein [Chelativorans sp. EGI FJ00035]MCT7376333.1 lytic transglycosylase domain-containing protein [Chelativorans sp. EGI FJ00035]